MRYFCALFLVLLASAAAFGQGVPAGFDLSNYGVRIEPDKRVIVVLATIEMANTINPGERLVNTPLSNKGEQFRARLLTDHANVPEDLRRKVWTFISAHKRRNPKLSDADLIAPFISMAYALTPVPELADPVITSDLPGSLLDVLDFAPLVREFYRRGPIGTKLDDYVKDYRAESDLILRTSAKEMVKELLDYMHTRPRLVFAERVKVESAPDKKNTLVKTEVRETERRFFLVPELLAAKSNIIFVNVRDDYYVVVPPDTDLSFSDARRAYLRFVIDPLVLANANEVNTMRAWAKPLLDERRKADPGITADPFISISRSLVAAADIRQSEFAQVRIATEQARAKIALMKSDAEKRAVSAELEKFKSEMADESALRLWEDYEKGAVLAFYFAEQLKGIEESGFDIAASMREMIAAFDPVKETERIAASAEPRKRALAAREARRNNPDARPVVENPVTARLLQIEETIKAKNFAKAGGELQQLARQYPTDPRIHFNLGRVASLDAATTDNAEAREKKILDAKDAFVKVISSGTTDRALLSLTYVSLARIYEYFDENAYALRLYDEAIKLGEVAGGAFPEAMAAKQRLIKQQ